MDNPQLNQTSSVPVASPMPPVEPGPAPIVAVKYAGFWIRFVAIMVDALIIIIPIGIAQFVTTLVIQDKFVSGLLGSLIGWLYFSLMTYYKGATLGKMLVGITVKSDNLERLSFGKVLLREILGRFVSGIILCIGYLMAGFTQKKQGLHDMIAHSVVVYKDPGKSHTAGLVVGIIIAAILPILIIMGLLSAVVLGSLSSARLIAQDAATKANLASIRPNAELYNAANNNSYSIAQNCTSGMFTDQNIQMILSAIKTNVTCYAEGSTYAVSATLNDPAKSYCFDNTGYEGDGIATDDGSMASCKR